MKHRTILLLFLLPLLLPTIPSRAADTPEKKPAKTVPEPNASAAWQRRIPDYLSDNLPLGEIVQFLRNQFPEINFIIKQQADLENDVSAVLVRMTLRAVTLQEFLKALEIAAQRPIQITGGPDERLVVFESKRAAAAVDAAGLPLQNPVQTRVFSLSKYLADRSDEEAAVALKELEQVIHRAGEMLVSANNGEQSFNPRLNLHRGTKLLIAVGRHHELVLVEQVVMELQRSWEPGKVPANPERSTKPPGEQPGVKR